MEEKKEPLCWKEEDGTILYGIPDLNRTIAKHNKLLKKYYVLGWIFVIFIICVVLWILWELKHYKIITLLINAMAKC